MTLPQQNYQLYVIQLTSRNATGSSYNLIYNDCSTYWCPVLYVVDAVTGVAFLDNTMYVVFRESPTILLYNTETLSPVNAINIYGMGDPLDIVVCRDDRQLYIAGYFCIWHVSLQHHSCAQWVLAWPFRCTTLSLTSRWLLMTSQVPPGLCQYDTTTRQLLRVVSLPQDVKRLWHGVETTRGTFVVGHIGTARNEWQSAVSELFSYVNCQQTALVICLN